MPKIEPFVTANLNRILTAAETRTLDHSDKLVIFSDLHIGDGGKNDDFLPNADLFSAVLRDHYLDHDYHLILNGDVEELQRFSLSGITNAHPRFYELMGEFLSRGRLTKTIGNHDLKLLTYRDDRIAIPICEGVRYKTQSGTVFLFHGHQASYYFGKYNHISEYVLRAIANPFHIGNFSAAHSSTKQYKTERRVYGFSKTEGIASIIGHTHRPLFESLSKWDEIRYRIEDALRRYLDASTDGKAAIEAEIRVYRNELEKHRRDGRDESLASQVYDAITVPSVFNSGCVIGKRGMTGIEIEEGLIRLVYWFDKSKSRHYLEDPVNPAIRLGETPWYRKILREERLSYVFARIRLLS